MLNKKLQHKDENADKAYITDYIDGMLKILTNGNISRKDAVDISYYSHLDIGMSDLVVSYNRSSNKDFIVSLMIAKTMELKGKYR